MLCLIFYGSDLLGLHVSMIKWGSLTLTEQKWLLFNRPSSHLGYYHNATILLHVLCFCKLCASPCSIANKRSQ